MVEEIPRMVTIHSTRCWLRPISVDSIINSVVLAGHCMCMANRAVPDIWSVFFGTASKATQCNCSMFNWYLSDSKVMARFFDSKQRKRHNFHQHRATIWRLVRTWLVFVQCEQPCSCKKVLGRSPKFQSHIPGQSEALCQIQCSPVSQIVSLDLEALN